MQQHLLYLMQNSTYLFSSKAWQAQRKNSLCVFVGLPLLLRPRKLRTITMFWWLILQHSPINRVYLPQGGFKQSDSHNSSLSAGKMPTTAEHPFCILSTRELKHCHDLLWSTCLYGDKQKTIPCRPLARGGGGDMDLAAQKLSSFKVFVQGR